MSQITNSREYYSKANTELNFETIQDAAVFENLTSFNENLGSLSNAIEKHITGSYLLCGERGTGKSTLTNALQSKFKNKRKFVKIDCSKISNNNDFLYAILVETKKVIRENSEKLVELEEIISELLFETEINFYDGAENKKIKSTSQYSERGITTLRILKFFDLKRKNKSEVSNNMQTKNEKNIKKVMLESKYSVLQNFIRFLKDLKSEDNIIYIFDEIDKLSFLFFEELFTKNKIFFTGDTGTFIFLTNLEHYYDIIYGDKEKISEEYFQNILIQQTLKISEFSKLEKYYKSKLLEVYQGYWESNGLLRSTFNTHINNYKILEISKIISFIKITEYIEQLPLSIFKKELFIKLILKLFKYHTFIDTLDISKIEIYLNHENQKYFQIDLICELKWCLQNFVENIDKDYRLVEFVDGKIVFNQEYEKVNNVVDRIQKESKELPRIQSVREYVRDINKGSCPIPEIGKHRNWEPTTNERIIKDIEDSESGLIAIIIIKTPPKNLGSAYDFYLLYNKKQIGAYYYVYFSFSAYSYEYTSLIHSIYKVHEKFNIPKIEINYENFKGDKYENKNKDDRLGNLLSQEYKNYIHKFL